MKKNKLFRCVEFVLVLLPLIITLIQGFITIAYARSGSLQDFNFIDNLINNLNSINVSGIFDFVLDIGFISSSSLFTALTSYLIYYIVIELLLFIPFVLTWFINLGYNLLNKLGGIH